MRRTKICILLWILCISFVNSGLTQEIGGIINLAVPKESNKGGWNLDAETSESNITLGWTDSSGQKYSTPIAFYNYPDGTFGARAVIQDMTNALLCPTSLIPLAKIRKILPFYAIAELIPDSPTPYKGYSLLDAQNRPTQFLEINSIGKDKEQLSFSSGTIYFIFPGGSPDSGFEMLSKAPGTRFIVHPGAIADNMKLIKGTLIIDTLLKDITVKDSGKSHVIKNVLIQRVSTKGNEMPEIISMSKEQ
jgi:hypothetical protein